MKNNHYLNHMPSTTGFVYHEHLLDHDTGEGHPERPDRLRSITDHLHKCGHWHQFQHLVINQASEEWILNVHTR